MTYLTPGSCYTVACDQPASGRYVNGWFCAGHAPTAPTPDPAMTLAALRAAGGFTDWAQQARKGGSDILKERPGGYVSRQRAERIGNGTAERQHH